MRFDFEWDSVKAITNLTKHKVSFERATEIFMDPFTLSIFDEFHSKNEDRWITIGNDRNNITLVVIHTFKEIDSNLSKIRIISARKATKNEKKHYNKGENYEKGI